MEARMLFAAGLNRGARYMDHFRYDLRGIAKSRKYEEIYENSGVSKDALRLYMLGHKDMVDGILYAS